MSNLTSNQAINESQSKPSRVCTFLLPERGCGVDSFIIVDIIISSCLTSSDSSKPIQKRISANHEGLSTHITIVVIIVAGMKRHKNSQARSHIP